VLRPVYTQDCESEELKNGSTTHAVATKFGHNRLHSLFILFEKQTQLFVFLLECMVFDYNLSVGTLQFRFERF
jgi:hypothetical protein